jgi:predicted negative regulator of RcsB-dependent stress response
MAFDFYALTEQEKVDLVKDVVHRYGRWMIVFLIILALCFAGFSYRNHHQGVRAESASRLYQSMLTMDQQKDFQKAESLALSLMDEYDDLHYANWAAFYLAKRCVDERDWTTAKQYLNRVMNHQPTVLERNLAFMRLAEIHIELQEWDDARRAVEDLDESLKVVRGNMQGDLHVAAGLGVDAKREYQKSMLEAADLPLAQEWLRMKLSQLSEKGLSL